MTLRLFVPLIVIVLLSIAFVTQPLQADQQITVLVIDGKYFPIEQFIAAGQDICVDNHYHAADFNSVTSLDGAILYDEDGCGYGPIDSIPVNEVTVKDDGTVSMVNSEGISVASTENPTLAADMTLKECEAALCGPYSSENNLLNTVDSDDEFLYPVPIVNLGPNDAVNSQLVVTLSSEVTLGQIYYKDEKYGSVLDFGGTFTGCTDTGIIVCSLGTISPTEDPEDPDPYYLIFTVTANHFAEDIIPFFSATVTSKTADPDSENNRLVYTYGRQLTIGAGGVILESYDCHG